MSNVTVLQAAAGRRFLATAWPWRSVGYLLTTLFVSAVALPALALLVTPWIAAGALVTEGVARGDWPHFGVLAALLVAGTIAVGTCGPLVALPLEALERWRLRLVDSRSLYTGHRPPSGSGALRWLRTRYTEPATWRALVYALLLVSVLTVLAEFALLLILALAGLAVSPLILLGGGGPISYGVAEASTPWQAVPSALGGLALLVVTPYLLALLTGVHAAVARSLLGRGRAALHAQLVEVSRSRARLVNAFEAERRRIERDLHDGAQQQLANLTLQLGLARVDLPPDSAAASQVEKAHDQAKQLMAELRELIHAIHPRILTDRGLPAALPGLAERCTVPTEVTVAVHRRLPAHIEATAYFVVAEMLANVAKHSGATSAAVTARLESSLLVVEVGDDGKGAADPRDGTGITGLADRVAVVDGRILLSSPSGGPTLVRVELPCHQNAA